MFWKRVFIITLLLIGAIATDVTCENGVDWEKCEAVPEILVDGCDYCDLRVKLSSSDDVNRIRNHISSRWNLRSISVDASYVTLNEQILTILDSITSKQRIQAISMNMTGVDFDDSKFTTFVNTFKKFNQLKELDLELGFFYPTSDISIVLADAVKSMFSLRKLRIIFDNMDLRTVNFRKFFIYEIMPNLEDLHLEFNNVNAVENDFNNIFRKYPDTDFPTQTLTSLTLRFRNLQNPLSKANHRPLLLKLAESTTLKTFKYRTGLIGDYAGTILWVFSSDNFPVDPADNCLEEVEIDTGDIGLRSSQIGYLGTSVLCQLPLKKLAFKLYNGDYDAYATAGFSTMLQGCTNLEQFSLDIGRWNSPAARSTIDCLTFLIDGIKDLQNLNTLALSFRQTYFKSSDFEYFTQELACLASRVTNLTISLDDSKVSDQELNYFFVNSLQFFQNLNYLNLNLRYVGGGCSLGTILDPATGNCVIPFTAVTTLKDLDMALRRLNAVEYLIINLSYNPSIENVEFSAIFSALGTFTNLKEFTIIAEDNQCFGDSVIELGNAIKSMTKLNKLVIDIHEIDSSREQLEGFAAKLLEGSYNTLKHFEFIGNTNNPIENFGSGTDSSWGAFLRMLPKLESLVIDIGLAVEPVSMAKINALFQSICTSEFSDYLRKLKISIYGYPQGLLDVNALVDFGCCLSELPRLASISFSAAEGISSPSQVFLERYMFPILEFMIPNDQ